MIRHRSEFRLLVEMGDGGGGVAAGSHPQATVLNTLQLILGGITGIRGPDRRSVANDRLDIGFIRAQHHFFLAAPASAGQCAESAELPAA